MLLPSIPWNHPHEGGPILDDIPGGSVRRRLATRTTEKRVRRQWKCHRCHCNCCCYCRFQSMKGIPLVPLQNKSQESDLPGRHRPRLVVGVVVGVVIVVAIVVVVIVVIVVENPPVPPFVWMWTLRMPPPPPRRLCLLFPWS